MKIIYIIIIFIFIGCSSNTPKYKAEDLIGYWAKDINSNINFIFRKDNLIEYPENNSKYYYYLDGKELIIKEEGHLITKYRIIMLDSKRLDIKTMEGNIIKLQKIQ